MEIKEGMSLININISANLTEESQKEIIMLAKTVLEPFGFVTAMVSDQLAYYRLLHLIRISDMAKAKLKEKYINPKAIEKKFLSRFIEEASHEDDPDLQEMWANLLASESQSGGKSFYINILKEIDRDDARLLKDIYSKLKFNINDNLKNLYAKHTHDSFWGSEAIDIEGLKKLPSNYLLLFLKDGDELSNGDEKIIKSFQKLESLRLIEIYSYNGAIVNPDGQAYVFWAKSNFLGQDFISTCMQNNEVITA